MLNIYLLFIFNKSKNFWDKNLIFNSLIFIIILAFIIFINNLNYLTSHAIRLTFFEPMEIRMYLNDSTLKGMDVITLDVKNNLIYFYNLFLNIYVKFKSTTFIILGKFNSNTLPVTVIS